jgi:hypothetical protein
MNVRGRARCTITSTQEVIEVGVTAGRVRVPETFPRERVVLGELHLLRSRLDGVLDEIGAVLRQPDVDEDGWPRVEEAARLAPRALVAAVGAVPPLPTITPVRGLLQVGELRVDPADQQMHEAIRGLYAEEPICDRQQRSLQPVAVPRTSDEPSGWLAAESAKLERLEQQLGKTAESAKLERLEQQLGKTG